MKSLYADNMLTPTAIPADLYLALLCIIIVVAKASGPAIGHKDTLDGERFNRVSSASATRRPRRSLSRLGAGWLHLAALRRGVLLELVDGAVHRV